MPASLSELHVTLWHWLGFTAFVVIALAIDLGVFHRKSHEVSMREALGWTVVWAFFAMAFGFWAAPSLVPSWTSQYTTQFITGYLVELSLSMDNVFVIALIFSYFRVPLAWQHRVLFWGILGALVMRGIMIGAGTTLIKHFHWMLYVMGAFLVVTGVKMLFAGGENSIQPERNWVVRFVRRIFPLSQEFDGDRFTTRRNGRTLLTPLALVLVVVETTDLIFALDSIPAIFGVSNEPFLVFTSNVFAVLGLRSLYFVLARAMRYFRFLKYGLSLVLVFIGFKMLFEIWLREWLGDQLTNISLFFVIGILVVSVLASLVFRVDEEKSNP